MDGSQPGVQDSLAYPSWIYNGTTDLDRFKYAYDRNSSPLYAYNNVDTDFGNQYAYDALNRLTDAKRGTINTGTGVVAAPDHREVYDLDATGNWSGYFVQDGQTTWKQRREFNQVNEIVDLTNWVVPEYDLAGNMTTIPDPADPTESSALTWDGWNRLVKVLGATSVENYAYDGLMRRLTSNDKTDTRHFYYSQAWQVVEERLNALTTADAEYVWGIRYIDDLVRRKKGTGDDAVIYALKDRMWSLSSLVRSTEGVMLERYVYDPYGKPTVLTGTFGPRASSLYSWSYLFQGREWDSLTGLYQFRMRYYHSGLGGFLCAIPGILGLFRYSDIGQIINTTPLSVSSPIARQIADTQSEHTDVRTASKPQNIDFENTSCCEENYVISYAFGWIGRTFGFYHVCLELNVPTNDDNTECKPYRVELSNHTENKNVRGFGSFGGFSEHIPIRVLTEWFWYTIAPFFGNTDIARHDAWKIVVDDVKPKCSTKDVVARLPIHSNSGASDCELAACLFGKAGEVADNSREKTYFLYGPNSSSYMWEVISQCPMSDARPDFGPQSYYLGWGMSFSERESWGLSDPPPGLGGF